MRELVEKYNLEKRAMDELQEQQKQSVEMERKEKQILQNLINEKMSENQETNLQLQKCHVSLQDKEQEMEVLCEKLSTNEKAVTDVRERSRSEMETIKAAVDKTKKQYKGRIAENEKEKINVISEVKPLKAKLLKLEKEVQTKTASQEK